MGDEALTAWCDESMRTHAGETTYYICAVLSSESDRVDTCGLERLKPRKAAKLHWRELGTRAQETSLREVAGMGLRCMVVTARPVNPRKPERARRKCPELLIPLLGSAGVGRMVLESRSEIQDKRDREMAVSLERKGWSSGVRLCHQRGEDQPMLWIPDQVVGAIGHLDVGGAASPAWLASWRRIERLLERRDVAL